MSALGVLVEDALAYVCPECDSVCAFPQQSAGRVFFAEMDRDRQPTEFRVSKDAEDMALAVHAHFGVVPAGDPFALPVQLALRLVGNQPEPAAEWKVLDGLPADARARPYFPQATLARIDALRDQWQGESRASIFRWLIAAAWQASLTGLAETLLRPQMRRPLAPDTSFPEELSALARDYDDEVIKPRAPSTLPAPRTSSSTPPIKR